MSAANIHSILREHWGFSEFRPLQEDIIRSVLAGKDTLALMPTGGGKSLTFQVPSLAMPGCCLVISPLIALMKDQVMNLRKKEIRAAAVYSGMSRREIDLTLNNCLHGDFKFLYLSPERLQTKLMQEFLPHLKINLLAVDEAHCISQWGYDFRPSYRMIAAVREQLEKIPVLALTASATQVVVKDIMKQLQFRTENIFRQSFERKNLSYSVLKEDNKDERLLKMLNKVSGTAIVYTRNRRRTAEISKMLSREKIASDFYHAGLTADARSEKQEAWMKNKTRVMVTTNAFGMGIDKPDVRLVVHMDVPDSLEAYFQEAGRGGRDGKKSFSVLMHDAMDSIRLTESLAQQHPSPKEIRSTYNALCNFLSVAVGAGQDESFDFDIAAFVKNFNLPVFNVLGILRTLEHEEILSFTENVWLMPRIRITASKEELYRFEIEHPKHEPVVKAVLRSMPGVFEDFVNIRLKETARMAGMELTEFEKSVEEISKKALWDYEPVKDKPQVVFLQPRMREDLLPLDEKRIERLRKTHEERVKQVKKFLTTNHICRSAQLLNYFGEEESTRCGICDVCLRRNRTGLTEMEFENISAAIKAKLSSPASLEKLVDSLSQLPREKTLTAIQWMVENDLLKKSTDGIVSLPV